MPKIKYRDLNLGPAKLAIVEQANAIIHEYRAQGFDLTLRQLYYQFVARDLLANRLQEYKRLGDVINDGRLVGLIDWDAIVDRTRSLRSLSHWDDPPDILTAVADQFHVDLWETQPNRVEVWIEKDALVGVIEGVCKDLDVPYFSCRGYTSQSEMWAAAMRLRAYVKPKRKAGSMVRAPKPQTPIILHFGDHDPSGIDMTRDITDRLQMFMGGLEIRRLALHFDQIESFGPPPNPAKVTDSRATAYIREYGRESWELDALDPATLAGLIRNEIENLIRHDAWQAALKQQEAGRSDLQRIAERFEDVRGFLGGDA
jgi:hypothetical protein